MSTGPAAEATRWELKTDAPRGAVEKILTFAGLDVPEFSTTPGGVLVATGDDYEYLNRCFVAIGGRDTAYFQTLKPARD